MQAPRRFALTHHARASRPSVSHPRATPCNPIAALAADASAHCAPRPRSQLSDLHCMRSQITTCGCRRRTNHALSSLTSALYSLLDAGAAAHSAHGPCWQRRLQRAAGRRQRLEHAAGREADAGVQARQSIAVAGIPGHAAARPAGTFMLQSAAVACTCLCDRLYKLGKASQYRA